MENNLTGKCSRSLFLKSLEGIVLNVQHLLEEFTRVSCSWSLFSTKKVSELIEESINSVIKSNRYRCPFSIIGIEGATSAYLLSLNC